jgi:hypothetical protein
VGGEGQSSGQDHCVSPDQWRGGSHATPLPVPEGRTVDREGQYERGRVLCLR